MSSIHSPFGIEARSCTFSSGNRCGAIVMPQVSATVAILRSSVSPPRIGSGCRDGQQRIFEKRLEIETGEMRLAADDAQIERLRDAQIAGEIVRHHRLFEPVHVIVLKFAAHLNGDVGGPAHIDVDHDVDVRARALRACV